MNFTDRIHIHAGRDSLAQVGHLYKLIGEALGLIEELDQPTDPNRSTEYGERYDIATEQVHANAAQVYLYLTGRSLPCVDSFIEALEETWRARFVDGGDELWSGSLDFIVEDLRERFSPGSPKNRSAQLVDALRRLISEQESNATEAMLFLAEKLVEAGTYATVSDALEAVRQKFRKESEETQDGQGTMWQMWSTHGQARRSAHAAIPRRVLQATIQSQVLQADGICRQYGPV